MPQTTWKLKLDAKAATRDARGLKSELVLLQGALEGVDRAARAANSSLAGGGRGNVAARVRAERTVADTRRNGITEAERADNRRQRELWQALQNEDRHRTKAARDDERRQRELWQALRSEDQLRDRNARVESVRQQRAQRDDDRRQRELWQALQGEDRQNHRNAQGRARLNAQAFRRDQADGRARVRQAQQEHGYRRRIANQMLLAHNRQQRVTARERQRDAASHVQRRGGSLSSFGSVGGALAIAGLITGATVGSALTLADMAVSAGRIALNLGESVLQMIAFRESALVTLRAMNGGPSDPLSATVAAEQWQFARQFARETPLDTQQVLQLQQQVSTAGFRGQQNRDVVLAGADVGAANPNDPTAASRYVRAVSQIRNAGRVRGQELNQLGEVGISRRDMLLALGEQGNVRRGARETDTAYIARLGRLQEGGRFTGEQGVAAAQNVVRDRWSNGSLGSFSRQQGDTLMGTLSNLRGALFDLVTGINGIEQLPGIRLLKQTLNGIANTIAGVTPTGKRLQAIVASIVNDVGMLVGGSGLADFDAVVGNLLDQGKDILPIVQQLVGAFGGAAMAEARAQFGALGATFRQTLGRRETLVTAVMLGRDLVTIFAAGARMTARFAGWLGNVTAGAAALSRALGVVERTDLQGMVNELFRPVTLGDRLRGAMGGVGDQAVLGIRMGIQRSMPGLNADVAAMAASIPKTSASTLEVKSPSRVMADEIGQHIPAGIMLGIERGRGPLDRAVENLVGLPDVPTGRGALGAGGLAGSQFHFHFTAPDGADENAGRTMARAAYDELARLLEPLALAA